MGANVERHVCKQKLVDMHVGTCVCGDTWLAGLANWEVHVVRQGDEAHGVVAIRQARAHRAEVHLPILDEPAQVVQLVRVLDLVPSGRPLPRPGGVRVRASTRAQL